MRNTVLPSNHSSRLPRRCGSQLTGGGNPPASAGPFSHHKPATLFALAAALMLAVWAIGTLTTSAMTEHAAEQVRKDMELEK